MLVRSFLGKWVSFIQKAFARYALGSAFFAVFID